MQCNPKLRFLNGGGHFAAESHDGPEALDEYKQWLIAEYDLDPDHEVFDTHGALTSPDFWDYSHLFEKKR